LAWLLLLLLLSAQHQRLLQAKHTNCNCCDFN
jgi:hypothetical protein